MLPKPIEQLIKYNPFFLPKKDTKTSRELNQEFWNQLMLINSGFPKALIVVEHIIKDLGQYYTLDLKLSCKNETVQAALNSIYEK